MKRTIKRYENRKLYDTESKKYVTLPRLAEFIRDGEEIEVLDNVSGVDLTNQVLTQLIFEEGKKGKTPIPSEVLHDMIRLGGEVIDSGVDQMVKGVDRLVKDSIQKFLPVGNAQEIQQLEQKVSQLEDVIETLLNKLENQQQHLS
jgi:polyhydroxyalkanoate synthesis repressor PhaR